MKGPPVTKQSESPNAIVNKLLKAITEVDAAQIEALCIDSVELQVPGAKDVDLTASRQGSAGFSAWAAEVSQLCGKTTFLIHRYFENGCELMAAGSINIERLPRVFSSPCSILVRFDAGRIALFQLLVDSYALEKFRGQMD
jgi:ketosteroid isomerase-like protein